MPFQTTRIEVNEFGDYLIQIPLEIMEEHALELDDQIEWDGDDSEFIILSKR